MSTSSEVLSVMYNVECSKHSTPYKMVGVGVVSGYGMGRVHCIKEAVHSPRAAPRLKNVEQYALYHTLPYTQAPRQQAPIDYIVHDT